MKHLSGFICSVVLICCGSADSENSSKMPKKDGLWITELVTNNDSLSFNLKNLTPDWIELYNGSGATIDLSDYYLSDDKESPLKAQLSGKLSPDSFAVFYASGIDSLENHLPFKLNNDGEIVLLTSKNKELYDLVEFSRFPKNVSFALIENEWRFSKELTPGKENSSEKIFNALSQNVVVDYSTTEGGMRASFSSLYSTEFKYKVLSKDQMESTYKTYDQPFYIQPGEVIKVKALGKSVLNHKAQISSYVPASKHELPIVSLVTEPQYLWSEEKGLYTDKNFGMKGEEWQHTASISLYMKDTILNHAIDFKIFGNASRRLSKKSLSIKSKTKLQNIMFSRTEADFVDGFLVRACHTGMNLVRNEFVNDINQSINGHLRMQEYVPAVLYLNGEYWGVYNIMERKNDEFIKNHTGHQATHMAMMSDDEIQNLKGEDNPLLSELRRLNEIKDKDQIFQALETTFRMDEFIDFWAHEFILARSDTYNNRFWKSEKSEDKKWGIITFDYDLIIGRPDHAKLFDKYFFSEPTASLKFINTLMRSGQFKEKLIYRICELLATAYYPSHVVATIEKYEALTYTEYLKDVSRWNSENNRKDVIDFGLVKKRFSEFFLERKTFLFDSIFPQIDYSKRVDFLIPEEFPGKVFLNGFEVGKNISFFTGMMFNVKVEPEEGVRFNSWKNDSETFTGEEFQFSNSISLVLDYESNN